MNPKKAKVPAVTPGENYGDRWMRLIWNNDLLTKIFVLLPAKSVTRCKLVCKHWLSLVSSEKFCHLHTLRSPKLWPSLLLSMSLRNPSLQFFNFDPIMNGEKLMTPYNFSVPNPIIISSCNGLMLLKSHHTDESFHVYNPTTKLSRKISVTDAYRDNVVALALAFDPSKSPHYKVVCIKSTSEDRIYPLKVDTCRIEVYDSESCAWKLTLRFVFPERLKVCDGYGGVYCHGSIYWEMLDVIVYYDIAKNEFETLNMPKYSPWDTTYCLQEAKGRLYKSRYHTKANNCLSIELFEMEMDDDRSSSWFLRYDETISQPEHTSPLDGYIDRLRFIKGSYGTEACSVVYHMGGKISVYSFLDKGHKLLVDLTGQPFHMDADYWGPELKMYEFIECLAVV
ncbi:F-box protein-like protein [Salvia divinorum]|uniref:F-box protein-like protein n=1 Tax=Salvia divinorum TaxID=28513 RepID=A0ABD1HKV1_SALDI